MSDKHSPAIELANLARELAALDQECAHWDYESPDPDCEHAARRDEIGARMRVLRDKIRK